MLKQIIFIFVFALFGQENYVMRVDGNEYSLQQFYSRFPKKQWERADSLQKEKMFTDFAKRELCILEAKKMGFFNDPDLAVKKRQRMLQALVNETYEQLVARPLISSADLDETRLNAKREVFSSHILIGHSDSYLAEPPERSLDDAFILAQSIKSEFDSGVGFGSLAEKYSDDPSVKTNQGSLGWIQWGSTVPEFQSAAFSLDMDVLSNPILTDFGYHLILATDTRPSDYQYVSDEVYEVLVYNISKNTIRDQLRGAALEYDSLKISNHGVVFNSVAISKIAAVFEQRKNQSSLAGSRRLDAASLLESVDLGVVCVYGGKGYGPLWFAYRLGQVPVSRQPQFDSEDRIVQAFKTILLQDIAVKDGVSTGVDSSFPFLKKAGELESGMLYDAYLKHLVNSSPKPDSSAVKHYYEDNKVEKYMEPKKVVVREIRVETRGLADSLLQLANSGEDFSSLAFEFSLSNPENGGLLEPFARTKNQMLYDAASLLEIDGISEVIQVTNSKFSIIQLVEIVLPKPLELSRVYARIESLLSKENQTKAKTVGVDGLLDKYSVEKNPVILNW